LVKKRKESLLCLEEEVEVDAEEEEVDKDFKRRKENLLCLEEMVQVRLVRVPAQGGVPAEAVVAVADAWAVNTLPVQVEIVYAQVVVTGCPIS